MRKTILITGSSSGIGKETAKLFQSKGWNVIATMRVPEAEKDLTALDNVLVTRIDVLDTDSIVNGVNEGIQKFGKIDVLVNNAGYGAYGTLESFSREQILKIFNTNVIGLLDVTKALLPHFRKNKSGVIINISSMAGIVAFPLGTLYHGTKFALEGISEALSYEVEQFGGKVKIVEPGAFATDFAGRSFDFSNDEALVEYQSLVGKVMAVMPDIFANAGPVNVVADAIYGAATDGTDQLRYVVGEDAEGIINMRRQSEDDEAFVRTMKSEYKS